MNNIKKLTALSAGLVASMLITGSAKASVAYDASLTNGVYYGSGNINGGFTIVTANGIEIGLRAKTLDPNGNNQVIDSSTDQYLVPPGFSPFKANRAAWNYDFSVDILGGPDTAISQLTTSLTITDLNNPGETITFDPQLTGPATLNTTGFQNSENPLFASVFPAGYNVGTLDNYQFTLTVSDGNGHTESDTIFVMATPEPSSIALMMAGGLLLFARRRSFGFARK